MMTHETDTYQRITVAVPTGRMAEFHLLVSRFLLDEDTGLDEGSSPNGELQAFAESSVETVTEWWGMLSTPAKRVLFLLAQEPGHRYTGAELAEACEIANGANGLAGTLSWPGKHARNRFGLKLPVNWDREDQEYWMDQPVATLIQQAAGAGEEQ
jgi:hypothetical protein